MAINHQKRENLLQESTAYSRRILLKLSNVSFQSKPVGELFAGCRPDGRWSLYFDELLVIQFDREEAIRRLFYDGRKYVSARGCLVEMVQAQKGGRVQLLQIPQEVALATRWTGELKGLFALSYRDLAASKSEIGLLGIVPENDQQVLVDLLALLSRKQIQLTVGA